MSAPVTAKRIVVLYDGQCKFCTQGVKNLQRMDGKDRLQLVSLHDPSVAELYPDLSFDQLMEQMWVVSYEGKKYGGADAVRYLSRHLPMLWPLAPMLHFPGSMPLWRFLYRQIAKRRYKIAGRHCDDGGTCSLHK
ncbi:thiol-disulfide oxidoreductase DCC family protein [Pirellulaceae bacterium SH449]